MNRKILASVLGAGLLLSLGACSTRAPATEMYLYYKSGAGDNKEFVECIEPGKAGSYPIDDEIFVLPTSLRTWNMRADGSGDTTEPIRSGSLPVGTQPGPEVVVWGSAEFYLNTDCNVSKANPKGIKDSPVVKFWENTGQRPWADGKGISVDGEAGFQDKSWKNMLQNTLVPSEERVIREETRKYTADQLDANLGGIYSKIERNLAPTFIEQLRQKLGGDYFCGVGYERGKEVTWNEWVSDGTDDKGEPKVKQVEKKGKCPPVRVTISGIDLYDKGIVESRAKVFQAEQEAKAKLIAAQAELDAARILGQAASNEAYLKYKQIEAQLKAAEACAKNSNCTVIIDGTGNAGVNVGK